MTNINFLKFTLSFLLLISLGHTSPNRSVSFKGTIVDEKNKPVSKATISCRQLQTQSNPKGQFKLNGSLKGITPSEPLTLKVSAKGKVYTYFAAHQEDLGEIKIFKSIPKSKPKPDGDLSICLYLDDRRGAVTMTFDDTKASHVDKVLPLLDQYGYKATFYVVTDRVGPGKTTNWDHWRAAHKNGHEIGNHTTGHYLKSPQNPANDKWNDDQINRAYKDLTKEIGVPPLTFAFPGGSQNAYTQKLIENTEHIDWRHSWHIKRHDRLYPEGDQLSVQQAKKYIDDILAHKKTWHGLEYSWFLFYMHEVTEARHQVLKEMCKYISENRKDLWTTTYARVTIYEQMRENTKIKNLGGNQNSNHFSMQHTLNSKIFNLPITVQAPAPQAQKAWILSKQDSNNIQVQLKNNKILVTSIPDGQPLFMEWQ